MLLCTAFTEEMFVRLCSHLLSCCLDVNQDITKQVRGYKNRYIRIDKPPTCKLDEGMYRLMSEPEGEIRPQVSLFVQALKVQTFQYNML